MSSGSSLTEHFFRSVVDNAAVASFDGYFQEVSTSWQETLGWSLEQLKSRPFIELIHPDDRDMVLESRARIRAGESVTGIQNRYRCVDGSYRWFEWRATGDVERKLIFAVARDITEQKEREALLEQTQVSQEELRKRLILTDRMATVGTLAAGMGHEINNPLASINANISLLSERLQEIEGCVPAETLTELTELTQDATLEKIAQNPGDDIEEYMELLT
jgi:PAS domain S-box-containing protein